MFYKVLLRMLLNSTLSSSIASVRLRLSFQSEYCIFDGIDPRGGSKPGLTTWQHTYFQVMFI